MNYYPFHIGDYIKETAHLTPIEDLAYRRLIDLYYQTEKPFPLDSEFLARLIRLPSHIDEVEQILSEFFTCQDSSYIHIRCDKEITKYRAKCESAANAIKIRWESKTDTKRNTVHIPTRTRTNNQKKKEHTSDKSDSFSVFWKIYPTKVGKQKALAIWKRKKPDINAVLKALAWQTATDQWQKGFIPNPATYLNEGRWEDEPVTEVVLAAIAEIEDWRATEEGIQQKGLELSVPQKPNESIKDYRRRLMDVINTTH